MTTTEELDAAVLKTLSKLCELLYARCRIKTNPDDGKALSLVPPSVSVALLLPNACQIAPTVHTSGPANEDPLFVKILSDVMVSTFCDSRIFTRSDSSDLQNSSIQEERQLANHYPISFTEFDHIRTQYNITNKTRTTRGLAAAIHGDSDDNDDNDDNENSDDD